MLARWRIPPDSSWGYDFSKPERPTIAINWAARSSRSDLAIPATWSGNETLSINVRHGIRLGCCVTYPTSRVTPCTGLPSSCTVPSVGRMRPDTILRIVDFPQPLGPTMVRNSPSLTSSDIPWTALMTRSRAKNRLPMFWSLSTGRPLQGAADARSRDRRDGVDLDHQLGLR